ncbi:hypothetical protein L596_026583 [Steinernema carpocapsae]|uniref:Uncharacterized protein n=1 Tax=Steinernema carpocapsae TaxID=34508 RepID=A0A4U5M1U1_STECR|nr:hypothetical protein L596_026583 [Steinernema carpocapsae]
MFFVRPCSRSIICLSRRLVHYSFWKQCHSFSEVSRAAFKAAVTLGVESYGFFWHVYIVEASFFAIALARGHRAAKDDSFLEEVGGSDDLLNVKFHHLCS